MCGKSLPSKHLELMEELCEKLNIHLMESFNYKSKPAEVSNFGKVIDARRKKFDLYIRVLEEVSDYWAGHAIVIARIGFKKTRQGSGGSLLELLTKFALEKSYDVIAIEQGQSPSIKCFASKYGFMEIGSSGNYTARTKDLAKLLDM